MASDETRARITAAAGPIFAEKGFQGATVREICDAAEVGLASVNYHFRDKLQLYVHVVSTALDYLDEHQPRKVWPPGTPPETRLRSWIERLTHRVLATPKDSWQERIVTREFRGPTPACEDVLHGRVEAELASLYAALDDVLPPEIDSVERLHVVLNIIGQILIYDTHRDIVRLMWPGEDVAEVFNLEKVIDNVTRMTLATLGLAPAIGRRRCDEEQQ